jgi:hypothetical protein
MLEHLKKILWIKHYNKEITSLHLFSSALILVLAAGLSYILVPFSDSLAATTTKTNPFGKITYTCTDKDNGKKPNIKSIATGKSSRGNIVSVEDRCLNENVVLESYCYYRNSSKPSQIGIRCGKKQICQDGVCIVRPTMASSTYSCIDSDSGENLLVAGSVTVKNLSYSTTTAYFADTCVSDTVVREGSCALPNDKTFSTDLFSCDTDQTCQNGACVPVFTPAPTSTVSNTTSTTGYTCADSDGGQFNKTKGTTIVKDASGKIISSETDRCIFGGLRENYCDNPFSSGSMVKNMPCDANSTCFDGACFSKVSNIPTSTPPTFSCVDSDGGQTTNSAGMITVKNLSTNSTIASFADSCYSTTMINEGYCFTANSDMYSSHLLACASNQICQSGACVQRPTPISVTTTVPFNVVITGDSPSAGSSQTMTILSGTQLGRFKITNNGNAKVTITDLKFTDNGTHTGTPTYKLRYSNLNSNNYTANIVSGTFSSVDFSNLSLSPLTIDGGTYRYVAVTINTLGGAISGDSWQLAVTKLGDIKYSVSETDLGYDANGNGSIMDTIFSLPVSLGNIPTLGQLIKQ